MLRAMILGNIGGDAVIKTFNDKNYIAFNVAHSEKRNGQETTQWVSVLKYGDSQSPIFQYLKKGTKVFVEGNESISTYTDAQGATKVSVNINADMIQLCGGQSEQHTPQPQPTPQQRPPQAPPEYNQPNYNSSDTDDLPF